MRRLPSMRAEHASERGQAMVEFALVAPIFFLLVFGIIQLGILFGAQNGLVDGVRDATRRAATYRINEASIADGTIIAIVCDAVQTELIDRLEDEVIAFNSADLTPTITYEWRQDPDTSKYFIVAHVTAAYDHPLYVPLIGYFLDSADGTVNDKLTLTASEDMRIENPELDAPVSTATTTCS